MGRGRAKAKQTKVARRLKYSTPQMDLDALREELTSPGDQPSHHVEPETEDDDFDASYRDDWDDDEDDEDDERSR